jgi:dihydroflavonol-4-reductase
MTISITGATGFIGSHLVDRLVASGHTVRVLVRTSSNLKWLKNKPVTLVHGDITDARSLEPFLESADYIYHVAGVVKARDREGYFAGNEGATRAMLETARNVAPDLKRFLFVSSQTAAGPATSLDTPTREDMTCTPITTYGESKLAAEKAVIEYCDEFPCTIVRPPAVYGPRDTEIFIYFQAVARGLNSIIGFDDKRLSLVHVEDLVSGIILAAESERAIGETYFIASDEYYSWPQVGRITADALGRSSLTLRLPHTIVFAVAAFAQAVAALTGRAATLNLEKARDITQRYWICAIAKAKEELGYAQQYPIERGIPQTIAWYREQGWLK